MLPFSLQQVPGLENLHYISISDLQNVPNWVLEESGLLTHKATQEFCHSLISSVAWDSLIWKIFIPLAKSLVLWKLFT